MIVLSPDYQLPYHLCASANAQKRMPHTPTRRSQLLTSLHDPQKPLLPVTVQDQIRLWELERNRIKTQEGMPDDLCEPFIILNLLTRVSSGFLYTAFASQADYEYVLNYAKQLDVVLWESAAKRCFFGSVEGHANIRGFIERRTGGGGGGL
jgi:transcription initiation factor TFIIH subunit 4